MFNTFTVTGIIWAVTASVFYAAAVNATLVEAVARFASAF